MRWFFKMAGQGFVVLLPLFLTLWLIIGVGLWVGQFLATPLENFFPHSSEFALACLGIALVLIVCFLFGLMLRLWLVRRLFGWVEDWFRQLPLVKTVYGAIHDVMQFLGGNKDEKKGDMIVVVKQQNGWRQIGIVTRQDFSDLPKQILGEDTNQVAIYFPFSYQLGGFSYFVDKSICEPVPGMSVEDAMCYSMMGWLGTGKSGQPPAPGKPVMGTDALPPLQEEKE